MVISCPRCNRKYQIDTTRIPVAGTSFTCWSCRAMVPIEPPAAVRAEMEATEPQPQPAVQSEPTASENGSVPPAAMRFFESLAAEAATRRASTPLPAPPIPPAPAAESPTLDLLAGDDILDLPPVHLSTAPLSGEVIDVGVPAAPGAPEPELLETSTGPTLSLASPPLRVVPREEPTPEPIGPPEPVAEPPRPLHVVPPSSRPEPIADLPAPTVEMPTTELPPEMPPTLALPRPAAETPAELAQRAWVAATVEEQAPGHQTSWLPRIAALAIVGLAVAVAAYWLSSTGFVTSPGGSGQASIETTPNDPAPAAAPASEAPVAPTSPAPQAAAPPAPSTSAPADSASGNARFTIQLRSSPSESDSKAFADSLRASGHDAYVARADLGARGVWYRVRVGRFGSRDEAQQAVAKLRAAGSGRDAIVVAYEAP